MCPLSFKNESSTSWQFYKPLLVELFELVDLLGGVNDAARRLASMLAP